MTEYEVVRLIAELAALAGMVIGATRWAGSKIADVRHDLRQAHDDSVELRLEVAGIRAEFKALNGSVTDHLQKDNEVQGHILDSIIWLKGRLGESLDAGPKRGGRP